MKKVRPYVGVFRRVSFLCGDDVKKMLYYAFFYSNIIYLITIWSGTKKENLSKIKILQNKCLRNLFFNRYRTGNISTSDLYNEYDFIEFENVIELEMNSNLHKIINKEIKCDIDIKYKNELHDHNTRHAKDMHKIKNKNKFGSFSFINRGISSYNKLSSPIKKAKNVKIFKRTLKKYFLINN